MSVAEIAVETLWSITAAQPMLWRVEHFLTNADEPCLQSKLNKLQQDAGLALAENLTGTAMEPYEQPENDHAGPELIAAYEPLTTGRLQILNDVQHALEAHGSEYYEEYSNFLAALHKLAPQAKIVPAQAGPAAPAV